MAITTVTYISCARCVRVSNSQNDVHVARQADYDFDAQAIRLNSMVVCCTCFAVLGGPTCTAGHTWRVPADRTL